jgi:hypothetical protein
MMVGMDPMPPEVFLAAYPEPIQEVAQTLRALVRRAVPEAIERVRLGWRLIGYDVPVGRRTAYFAAVGPEPEHIHLFFEHGVAMADPDRRLEGARLKLRQVRYLTFRPGEVIPEAVCLALIREAAHVAALPRATRLAMAADREWRPTGGEHG